MVSSHSPHIRAFPSPLSSLLPLPVLCQAFSATSQAGIDVALPCQAKQAGKETSMAALGFYLLMFYFTGRERRWQALMAEAVDLSSKSLLAPGKSLLCFQGARREESSGFEGGPLFTHITPVGVSNTLRGQAEIRTCPLTTNLCK